MKRSSAAFIFVAVVLVFSILGGYRSISRQRAGALAVFTQGTEGDGLGIAHDLQVRIDSAYNLSIVAKRYYDPSDALVTGLLDARGALIAAEEPDEKFAANRVLSEKTAALCDALAQKPLSEMDAKYRVRLWEEMKSADARISHDGFNRAADDFNQKLMSFPIRCIAKLTGVGRIALYA